MSFDPKFQRESSLERVAELINRPHEDYPLRVDHTRLAITDLYSKLNRARTPNPRVTWSDAADIHRYVMFGLRQELGVLRSCNVVVGRYQPPRAWMLNCLIKEIFPIQKTTDIGIVHWYKRFQEVHPFRDGNGRVGGIIVAALSFNGHNWLTPDGSF